MKTFVLIVIFSATTGLIGGGRTDRIVSMIIGVVYQQARRCTRCGIGNACRGTSRCDALADRSRFRPQGSPTGRPFTCGDL